MADCFIIPIPCVAKQVPVAYGIKKLQISCVVEDDKIGTDFLEESITAFEDHVSWHDCVFARPNIIWHCAVLSGLGSKCGYSGL